jgi:hypothetical protein
MVAAAREEEMVATGAYKCNASTTRMIWHLGLWITFSHMKDAHAFVWPMPMSNASYISSMFGMCI